MLEKVVEEFEAPGLEERIAFVKQLFANDSC
jgi:hypothetical protein